MLAERAKAIQRVCFDAEPSESDLNLLGSRERWLIYRDLVRHRLIGVVEAALPRSKAAIGDEAFGRAIDEWLSAGGPRTRYFRELPIELAELSIPTWTKTEPAWVAELARFEIGSWEVRHGAPKPAPSAEFAFDRRPVVGEPVRVLRLAYPVHRRPTPESGYEPEATTLCLHRNEEHKAVPHQLNPLAADLLEAWQRGNETVAESVQRIAAEHGSEIGPAFVEKLSAMVADFIERGIIVGGMDSPA